MLKLLLKWRKGNAIVCNAHPGWHLGLARCSGLHGPLKEFVRMQHDAFCWDRGFRTLAPFRAYDFSDPLERNDFILDFKFSKAE
eukprot:484592-Amphidinium_carterae.1